MTDDVPMFPLNAVVFPGVSVPLRVFEDRYTAMVRHLLDVADPAQRVFGSVAIREGYEVGDHGAQSLFRVGVLLQLTEVTEHPDGTFDVVGVGRDRIRLDGLRAGGEFPVGQVEVLPEPDDDVPDDVAVTARAVFTAYREMLRGIATDPFTGDLPVDPVYLAWTLAACAPLPMSERQSLLEADTATERLELVTDLLRTELEAMNVIPSLPASEVARTRWSPN